MPPISTIDANAATAIGATVTVLTQLIKWAGLPDRLGPVVVLILSAIGVGVFAYSLGDFQRSETFNYLSAWANVALVAAGIFGFTRAAPSAVTALRSPPAGAAQSPTVKE
jgi:O-antigen/teichoic acid export membrane protein